MRMSSDKYLRLRLRVHEFLRDVPLYDLSAVEAVYVMRVSWLTRPYLIAIEPFRRILYPAMLRRIRRAWVATYVRNRRSSV